MSQPIPVFVCGKIPSHLAAVPRALSPEYEVLQVFYNVEDFVRTFPKLEQKPAAIFMGGGFDHTEFDIAHSVPGASSVPWFRPFTFKPGNEHMLGKEAPPAHVVAAAARTAIDERVETLRNGEGAGEIWYY